MYASTTNDSKIYGLKHQARCIAAQGGDESRATRYLVGTLSLREENEVHVLEYKEDGSEITCEGQYLHQNEIWDLSPCPYDGQLLSTISASQAGEYTAAIWRIPKRSSAPTQSLEQVVELKGHSAAIKCVIWSAQSRKGRVVSVDEETLRLWDFDESGTTAKLAAEASAGELHQLAGGRWDPHDDNAVATPTETAVKCWDLRTMKVSQSIEQAHAMQVRDIDYSPKQAHLLLSAGDDSKIRFWDLRYSGMPLVELAGHSHWTWRAQFNPFYDTLVLSSGTDAVVNLWHVPSLSKFSGKSREPEEGRTYNRSASSFVRSPFGSPRSPLDDLVRSYNEHEDSVYGIAWSRKDPWVFASVSHDGRVTVDTVPQAMRKTFGK